MKHHRWSFGEGAFYVGLVGIFFVTLGIGIVGFISDEPARKSSFIPDPDYLDHCEPDMPWCRLGNSIRKDQNVKKKTDCN